MTINIIIGESIILLTLLGIGGYRILVRLRRTRWSLLGRPVERVNLRDSHLFLLGVVVFLFDEEKL